ncbi:hypothetical protein RHMOL_Rhmol01G0231600 [Rhododendron molle]|uniref:Uncharacterized protein n=1 Tax=Rhododendron molle TaxID=49168 RepID=A0ACC0Q4D3_RHOML|nr:hypothetical protein RHMOL_Rhmol01G0231600 [Rhododendron molle]
MKAATTTTITTTKNTKKTAVKKEKGQSKKILNAQFDKLPLHGLGKELSANWWKALGYQLISHCMYAYSGDFFCYLTDTIRELKQMTSAHPKKKDLIGAAKCKKS